MNISRVHNRYISVETPSVPVSNIYVTRYSGNPKGWTTDGLPRQLSIDTLGMKDHPLPPKPPVTKGLPDQIKYMPDVWIKLTRTRQEWLFEVNCLSAYGKIPTGAQLKVAKATWAKKSISFKLKNLNSMVAFG